MIAHFESNLSFTMVDASCAFRHPISLAGVISILSVLTSPLTQQAIEYPTRSAGDYGRATVGMSHHWQMSFDSNGVNPLDMALTEGMYTLLDDPPTPLEAVCPTANCSFTPYQSLAMCVKVADGSSSLVVSTVRPEDRPDFITDTDDDETTFMVYTSLPNGVNFDTVYPYALRTQPGNSSIAFEHDEAYPSAIIDYFVVYTALSGRNPPRRNNDTDISPPKFHAIEILLYLCVNEYETQVTEGQSRSKIKSSKSTLRTEGNFTEIPRVICDAPP